MLVTAQNAEEAIRTIRDAKEATADCETTGLEPWPTKSHSGDKTCGLAILAGGKSWYFPCSHSYGMNLEPAVMADAVEALSEVPVVKNHNLNFDLLSLHCTFGMKKPKKLVCTQIGAHLMNENESHALKTLSDKYLKSGSSKEERELDDLLRRWGYKKDEMWRLDPSMVAPYAEQDVRLADALSTYIRNNLDPEVNVIWEECNEFSSLIFEMMRDGVLVDRAMLNRYYNESAISVSTLERSIKSLYHYNPNQPTDIMRHYRTQDSTYDSLIRIKDQPGIDDLLKMKSWKTARDTYYKAYINDYLSTDDRIHANIRPTGTISGRLAVRSPAMQAIPQRDDQQKVKDIFIAPEGYDMAELDYSQAEIRLGAHYTEDQAVMSALFKGEDIHQLVADRINEPRNRAKTINFSIIYGSGAVALAESLNIDIREASKILSKYHSEFPGYRLLSRQAETIARERGYIRMWTGRRRHFNTLEAETRKAFSNLIQGGVAEIVRRAMIYARRAIDPDRLRIVMQVHDSLLVYFKKGDLEAVKELKMIMEDNPWSKVPTKVDVKVGNSWGTMKAMNV